MCVLFGMHFSQSKMHVYLIVIKKLTYWLETRGGCEAMQESGFVENESLTQYELVPSCSHSNDSLITFFLRLPKR